MVGLFPHGIFGNCFVDGLADHGQPMAGAEEELVTMFSRLGRRGTVDEVLRKLLEPRPEHPRMQFAALSLMLLLTRQG